MMATYTPPGILVTIRNPHAEPLTPEVAASLGFVTRRDSSGLLAAVYRVDDDAEIEEIRATGLIVERVP